MVVLWISVARAAVDWEKEILAIVLLVGPLVAVHTVVRKIDASLVAGVEMKIFAKAEMVGLQPAAPLLVGKTVAKIAVE
jgi:hypothetical protein